MHKTDAFSYLFDIGQDILHAGLDPETNVALCQLGDSTAQTPDSDAAELWQTPGVWSLPAAPTPGQPACQAVCLKRSDHDIIIATRDVRNSSIYGNLKPGETCVGASTGQARTLYKANGSINHIVTSDNTPGGTMFSESLGPDGFSLVTPWGGITINSAGITITAGNAALVLTAEGDAKLIGQTASVNGSVAAIAGTVMTMIGPEATPVTGAGYGPPGGGPVVLASTHVFVSP